MKIVKKAIAVFLSAVMMICAAPITAGAYTSSEWNGLIRITDWSGELLKLRLYNGDNNTYLLKVEGIPDEVMDSVNTFLAEDSNNHTSTTFSAEYIDSNHNRNYGISINGVNLWSYLSKVDSYGMIKYERIAPYFEKGINGYNCVYILEKNHVKISDIKKWNEASFNLGGGTYGDTGKGGGYTFMEATINDIDLNVSEKETATKQNTSSLKITAPSKQTYTGKSKTPDVTIKDGNYTLKKGTDYTLTYKNNKKIGKATVTIKGKGKYTGSKSVTFNIVPKKVTLKASKGDNSVKLSWTKVTGAEKYQVYYSVNGGKYKKLTTTSKLTKTVKGLDFSKNSYKFKVRAVAEGSDGKTYAGSYSGVKTIKKR